MGVLGGTLLAAVLAVNVASLTDAPLVFGDESWAASIVWSASEGLGYEPSIAAGAGLYDGVDDYSSPRLGLLPNLLGELVFPTSLLLHRAVTLITALAALAVFWHAMRRVLGGGGALVATAALASSWAFFSMSHWVRWDPMGLLLLSVILNLLIAGPPRVRVAAIAGGLIGLSLDFSVPVAAVLPGVLLLCAWESAGRWPRIGALLCGVAAGGLIAAALHLAPSFDLPQARAQVDNYLGPPGYTAIPVVEAVEALSLAPILDEWERYNDLLAEESYRATLVALPIGLLAAILAMLAVLGLPAGRLALAGLCGLALIGADLAVVGGAYAVLRDAIVALILVGLLVALWLSVSVLRRGRPYPTEAVPGILLVGMLVGWGLVVGYKFGLYPGFAVLIAVGAVACALRSLSPPHLREAVPAIGLAAATVASAAFVVSDIRAVESEAALDPGASREARAIVPEGDTVVGDWVYWWLFEDERFRVNSTIWLQAWQHPDESFADSFHRVCPDHVLLDDSWLGRYHPDATERERYPNFWPSGPGERARLMKLLRSEYEVVESLQVEDRTLTFWRRLAEGCPAVGGASPVS